MNSLDARQEAMKERWAVRIEIEEAESKGPLLCPICLKSGTKANKQSGRLLLCRTCQVKDEHLRNRYGITVWTYNRLVAKQGRKCATCDLEADKLLVKIERPVGTVLGLVCRSCHNKKKAPATG